MTPVLHGYRPSVYVRVARLALVEKDVTYDQVEVNPFAADAPPAYLALQPFNRVPTLVHDGFGLYETGAITRYVDRTFAGPSLQPIDLRALARMDQIIGIIDSYAYWPLVRQVYVHAVGLPRRGQAGDPEEIAGGLADASFLVGPALSLADLHLLPMIAYFTEAPEGAALLARHPRLDNWFARMKTRPSFAATDPR